MQKNITLNIRDLKIKGDDFKNSLYTNQIRILIVLIYLAGLWLGTMLYIKNNSVSNIAQSSLDYLINADYIKIFSILVAAKAGTIATIFISGFSACGLLPCIGLPCIFGIICGTLNSCIYSSYRLNGVFFSLIIIIPFAVVTSLLITALSDNAINLSKQLMKSLALGEGGKRGEAKTYIYSGVIIIIIECVIDLLQAFLISKAGEFILSI